MLKVTSHDGGEVLASGGIFNVTWDTNDTVNPVAYVKLYCSTDSGKIWNLIGTVSGNPGDWSCVFPIVRSNKKSCLIRVLAYDSADKIVAKDTSDNPFTIEVVTLTSPNGGETLKSGGTHNIDWSTYQTKKEVAKVKLQYTQNGGKTWQKIKTIKADNPGTYLWTIPDVPKAKTKCKVKVQLMDINSKSLGQDSSDSYFTIEP